MPNHSMHLTGSQLRCSPAADLGRSRARIANMWKNNRIIGLALIIPLAVLSVFGCAKKTIIADEAIIRYQKIEIPRYGKSDYERLITSDNDEVKYNAICNLIPYAPEYARTLEKGPPDESSQETTARDVAEYKKAKEVFGSISKELFCKNKSIQAASLIFITDFSSAYSSKEEVLKLVLDVKTNEVRTQYEQIRALIELSDSDTAIEKNLIESFLDSRCWLIRSMTYLLLGNITSDDYHKRLIKEYKNANEEYDRLFIIHSFNNGYGPEVFDLIRNEVLSTNSDRIRGQTIRILKQHRDNTAVIKWLIHDHKTIGRELLRAILNEYYSEVASPTGTVFFHQLLRSNQQELIGLIDQEKFFQVLYDGLKNEASQKDLAELEMSVRDSQHLSRAWVTYIDHRHKERLREKEQQKREEELKKTVFPKYNAMLEKFLEDSKKLFADAGMDQDEIEELTKAIRELLQVLKEEESK